MKTPQNRNGNVLHGQLRAGNHIAKLTIKTESSRFNALVTRRVNRERRARSHNQPNQIAPRVCGLPKNLQASARKFWRTNNQYERKTNHAA